MKESKRGKAVLVTAETAVMEETAERELTEKAETAITEEMEQREKAETAVTEERAVSGISESEPLAPLKTAAERIARLLCELSGDSKLFVTEAGQTCDRRVDTKALKEFSGVLKEMSAVMSELHGQEGERGAEGVRIEFSDEALELGS